MEEFAGQPLAGDEFKVKPVEHVSFHVVGARGILFDSANQSLYLLNRVGGFIWCCLAEDMSAAEIARELIRRSNSDPNSAAACIRAAIRNWQTLGFLNAMHEKTVPRAARHPVRRRAAPPALEGRPANSRARVCRVLDCDFAVQFWNRALEEEALPLLRAHLVDSSPGVTATLEVACGEGGSISIGHGAETMQVLYTSQSLAPAVFASLMKLALVYSPTYPALHAAAVRTSRGVVLFPGASGCGKSTLMAGLLAEGRRVLSDDTAVFERETMRVRPLTPYLCIKSGSWDALARRLPELMLQPAFVRADDAHVRYLLPDGYSPLTRGDSTTGEEVRTVVFPHYHAGAATRLTRIAGFLALKELLPSLDPIGHDLEASDIDRLIGWMARVECYTLSYGSLGDAMATLSGIVD
ncbi:MAG TPA: PqqD family peptide modification chaperone [Gammaproteobacteria bacterium]|nr:PqqD family peptide modification chaperone [Gammaproteobacteria bacterium]